MLKNNNKKPKFYIAIVTISGSCTHTKCHSADLLQGSHFDQSYIREARRVGYHGLIRPLSLS